MKLHSPAIAVALTIAALGPANAELETGWNVTFVKDAFEGRIAAAGNISQSGDGFSKAKLNLFCDEKSQVVPSFRPEGFLMTNDAVQVYFRSGGKTEQAIFKIKKLPVVGGQWVASDSESKALLELIKSDDNALRFRHDGKEGQFSLLAAQDALLIVAERCQK